MIKLDVTKMYEFPEDSLSKMSDYGLTIPFANMDSTMRQHMWHSHLRQIIFPVEAERPIVDTRYTKDILFSSDNTLIKNDVTLLDKVEKNINGFITNTTYIYLDHSDGLVYIEKIGSHKNHAKHCYALKSDFEKMKIGEIKSNIYTKHIEQMDTRDGGIAFGKNVMGIYDIDRNIGEDSIVISKRLANAMRVNTYYAPEISFNPKNEMLLDRYGFVDGNGITNYKPFPLPGEHVKDGEVAVVSKTTNDFLSSSDDVIHASDIAYYVESGMVADVDVYSNDIIDNTFLENLRRIHLQYFEDILNAIIKLPQDKLSLQVQNYKQKMTDILSNKLRFGTDELNNFVKIKLTIIGEEPLTQGSKLTNRHGGKGTVSQILDEPLVSEFGKLIDIKWNATGVENRENVGQQMEHSLSILSCYLQEYLRDSNDSIDVKYGNFIKWIEIAKLHEYLNVFENTDKNMLIEHFSKNPLYMKYDPFDNEINVKMLFELNKFTQELCPHKRKEKVYQNGVELGDTFYPGEVFLVVLENGPRKDNSMRSEQINSSKGGLSKVGLDKKKFHSKYLTTAVKLSDLAQNIYITSQYESDKNLLSSDLSTLSRSLNAIGLSIGLKSNKGDNDK